MTAKVRLIFGLSVFYGTSMSFKSKAALFSFTKTLCGFVCFKIQECIDKSMYPFLKAWILPLLPLFTVERNRICERIERAELHSGFG